METAGQFQQARPSSTASPTATQRPERIIGESGKEIQPWEIKAGKTVFYLTIAAGLWFFYWFNGIQCPC
ncbi:MAG: hypothetical protein CV089_24010 [Nitrospira sp. WS110]|nr:hypothetical protein [Nitrospira sp. WS110]